MSTAPSQASDGLSPMARGILWMLFATVLFTGTNVLAKQLGQHYDIVQVVWARYTFHTVFFVILLRQGFLVALRSNQVKMQMSRSGLLLVSSTLYFTGFTLLPLAESAAMINITPLLVTIFSIPLLGESVGVRRWSGVVIGLIGALIIIRPGMEAFTAAAAFPLAAAFSYATYQLLTRKVSHADSAITSVTYTAVVGTVIGSIVVPFFWTTPDAMGWIMMISIGITGGLGHYGMVRAYAAAEVSAVAPFAYAVLLWMIIAGFFVFDDLPDMWTIIGAGIIAGSGLYISHRETAAKRKAAK